MHPDVEKDDEILLKSGRIQKPKINEKEKDNEYWIENGKKFVEAQFAKKPIENEAKNIIFFMGNIKHLCN